MNGPVEDHTKKLKPYNVNGEAGRYLHSHPNDNFEQPRALYRKVMSETDREHLIENICGGLSSCKRDVIILFIIFLYRSKKEW